MKIPTIILISILFLNSTITYARRNSKRIQSRNSKISATPTTPATPTPQPIPNEISIIQNEIQQPEPPPVPEEAIESILLLKIEAAAEEERKNEAKKQAQINEVKNKYEIKKVELKNNCSGIFAKLKQIKNLVNVSTATSGIGAITSGGALAMGLMKDKGEKDLTKKINNIPNKSDEFENETIIEIAERSDFNDLEEAGEIDELYGDIYDQKVDDYVYELSMSNNKNKIHGHIRTGLLGASIATSGASMGTSIASTVELDKLIKKMTSCNSTANQLVAIVSELEAEGEENTTQYMFPAQECKGFDINNIKSIKTVMTASSITSGVGTLAATAGTVTSAIANSKKITENEVQTKTENNLNLTSNIMAGITTGTSIGGIALGATAISQLSKNMERAAKCENAL